MIFSIALYGFYAILLVAIPYLFYKKKYSYLLMALLFSAQFNVTCIIKAGVTFTFFELSLLSIFICILTEKIANHKSLNWKASLIDKVFLLFLGFSFISICIAFIRLLIGNLPSTEEYPFPPLFRSIMSLNKPLFYLLLIPVGNYLNQKKAFGVNNDNFFKYLVYSGIIPSLAVVIQWLAIGSFIIHNNPSFSENEVRITYYFGERAVGLSNEAASHCFVLFFCLIGLVHSLINRVITKKSFFLLYSLFFISVIMTISRTGMIFFIAYSVYAFFKYTQINKTKKVLIISFMLLALFSCLSTLTFNGFNLYDRLLSTADVNADLSTIERYGLADAMLELFIDRGLFLGVGIYNYFYYLKDYIPDYMYMISYEYGFPLPSFNFILQLMAEYGLPLFIIFFLLIFKYIRRANDPFVTEWFVALFCFALSFQIFNFSLPFLIMLYYPIHNYTNDTKNYSFLLAKRRSYANIC